MSGYVIADANKTIWVCQDKTGSYSLTTDQSKALVFSTKPAADTIFKSNLSKLIKSKGVMVSAIDPHLDTPQKKVEIETSPESSKYIISVLAEAVGKLNCRHTALVEQLSKYDRQKSDVEHYIEFNSGKLNACDGYKAYKLLQDVLVERRKVKDELQIIQMVRDKMACPEDIANIKAHELEARTYEPREFVHLFETKEKCIL